jgi:AraC family transcriptional regulator of adaptative response / DNA-3-methyladenine glycosylase II
MFDLDARPDQIAQQLRADAPLANLVKRFPGPRLPGAMVGFEVAARAIIGQRISVSAATTLAGRFTCKFGESIETPIKELTRIAPTCQRIAAAKASEIAALGLTKIRAQSLILLARFWCERKLDETGVVDPQQFMEEIQEVPGIGPWTANYMAMRVLGWPDAFPAGDLVLCRAAGNLTPKQLEVASHAWRPWRAYAAILLWNRAADSK